MKKIIITVVVIVVAVVILLFALKPRKAQMPTPTDTAAPTPGAPSAQGEQKPESSNPASGMETVVMNESGFSPATLAIPAGTTVVFKNEGNADRWPASAVHPTHEKYPEFDPRRPVPPGGTWSFTFERAGTWNFHDHLAPRLRGTITVAPAAQ